jgi:hypothetical protein
MSSINSQHSTTAANTRSHKRRKTSNDKENTAPNSNSGKKNNDVQQATARALLSLQQQPILQPMQQSMPLLPQDCSYLPHHPIMLLIRPMQAFLPLQVQTSYVPPHLQYQQHFIPLHQPHTARRALQFENQQLRHPLVSPTSILFPPRPQDQDKDDDKGESTHADQDEDSNSSETVARRSEERSAILKQFEEFALQWQWHKDKYEADRVADSNTIGAHAHDTAVITSRQREQQELEDAPRKVKSRGHVRFTDQELLHHLGESYAAASARGVSLRKYCRVSQIGSHRGQMQRSWKAIGLQECIDAELSFTDERVLTEKVLPFFGRRSQHGLKNRDGEVQH